MRANQVRHEKELERRIIAQEKLQEAEMAKAQSELAKVMQERDRLQRAEMFEQQDVREEIHRSKTARQRTREKGSTNVGPATTTTTTPKKNKGPSYRDGFDQDEIMIVSPSRSAGRSRVGTPKAGGKRKRKGVDDSPLPALQLTQSPRTGVRSGREEEEEREPVWEGLSSRFSQADGRFEVSGPGVSLPGKRLTQLVFAIHAQSSHDSESGTDIRVIDQMFSPIKSRYITRISDAGRDVSSEHGWIRGGIHHQLVSDLLDAVVKMYRRQIR